MEDAFYAGHGSEDFADDNDGSTAPETESADTVAATGLDAETLTKILNNPELATLRKTLADKLQGV